MNLIFLLILIILLFYFILENREPFNSMKLHNIYDEPLQSCREGNMSSGSWDDTGKCSELGGGVHQICIKNIAKSTPNFSKNTGQSNWSNERGSDNHCVCLGAWSLYQAQNKPSPNQKVLKCESIPKVALSKNYVSKFSEGWNKWNGLELNNQIKNGVEGLFNNCYLKGTPKGEALKKNYCQFASEVDALRNSELFREMC